MSKRLVYKDLMRQMWIHLILSAHLRPDMHHVKHTNDNEHYCTHNTQTAPPPPQVSWLPHSQAKIRREAYLGAYVPYRWWVHLLGDGQHRT